MPTPPVSTLSRVAVWSVRLTAWLAVLLLTTVAVLTTTHLIDWRDLGVRPVLLLVMPWLVYRASTRLAGRVSAIPGCSPPSIPDL